MLCHKQVLQKQLWMWYYCLWYLSVASWSQLVIFTWVGQQRPDQPSPAEQQSLINHNYLELVSAATAIYLVAFLSCLGLPYWKHNTLNLPSNWLLSISLSQMVSWAMSFFQSVVIALSQVSNSLFFNSWNLSALNTKGFPFRTHGLLDFSGLNCICDQVAIFSHELRIHKESMEVETSLFWKQLNLDSYWNMILHVKIQQTIVNVSTLKIIHKLHLRGVRNLVSFSPLKNL